MQSLLEDLAFKYGTDKRHSKHDYIRTYRDLFAGIRHEPIKFLEIGVYNCASHHMWIEYFPNAIIYGIDTNDSKFMQYDKYRLILDKVDQGDEKVLTKYAEENGPWRIIIDDGGHYNSQQKISFKVLWEHVVPGGYYIVEDTHTSYWKEYMDSPETLVDHMLKVANQLSSAPHYKGYYANTEIRKHSEDLMKYQKEVESMTVKMGLIILKKVTHD